MEANLKIKQEVKELREVLEKTLYFSKTSSNIDFLISSLTEHNDLYSTQDIENWLQELRMQKPLIVERVPLNSLPNWKFNQKTGNLEHKSGGFFSIRGIKVKTNSGSVPEWSQPIIYQPEIGILGIITKRINGILYFLMQAKAEPGNLNTYQLSPTVQATQSNYKRVHGGKKTQFLNHFLTPDKYTVLIDSLGSEQGARFYCKRNRNIIIRLPDSQKINHGNYYRWMTLGQIQSLMQKDNLINMDTRSIISEIHYGPEKVVSFKKIDVKQLRKKLKKSSLVSKKITNLTIKLIVSSHSSSYSRHSMEDLLKNVTKAKFNTVMERRLIPFSKISQWKNTGKEIKHYKNKYFSIIGLKVRTDSREVTEWDQPIMKPKVQGVVGFISKEINGVLHFLVNLKAESGAIDLLEMSPTVQCVTDNYSPEDMPPYLNMILKQKGKVLVNTYQSEEGGRFFEESNRCIILLVGNEFPKKEIFPFMWMTLRQIKDFISLGGFVNAELRSLLACLKVL